MPQIDVEKLEEYAQKIFDRENEFNTYVLENIGRRLKAIGQLSAHDQQALKNMADISSDMKSITKKLAEITEMNIKDLEEIYTKVVEDSVNSYKPLYDLKNMEFIPFAENEFAQMLVRHWVEETTNSMINLSRTKALCFDKYDLYGNVIGSTPLEGAFQQTIDNAVTAISSGNIDFNTAMRKTIEDLGGSGVKVHYGSGVNRSLSAMIRQNLLYGAKQSAQSYDDYIGEKLGCDGFEVDAHSGCRPSHMFMQGKMYSFDGDKVIDGVHYPDGSDALKALGDYGCLHFKISVILGVSEPTYSKEELERIEKETTELIEFNGKKKTLYEWKQAQRRLERMVRQQGDKRNLAKAAGDNIYAKDCDDRIKAYRDKYDELCDKVGLEKRYDRMTAFNGKTVDNSVKSGIIEKEKKIISKTGRCKWSQEKIDDILNGDLQGIIFSKHPVYNSKIRCNGKTTIALDKDNKVLFIEKVEIGMQDRSSVEFLEDTIIHEELEARIAMRSNFSEKYKTLYNSNDEIRHKYINSVIERYFKTKGWWHDDTYLG